ncbi:MAG: hypothetical protein RIR69_468, partial [Actinomycetota bacterium]
MSEAKVLLASVTYMGQPVAVEQKSGSRPAV